MGTEMLHVGISAICPHGGQVQLVTTSTRVMLSNQPAVTSADQTLIAGCAFNISGAPHPCVQIQWYVPSTRIKIGGQSAVLSGSTAQAIAADQVPQGAPTIISTQLRVKGN